MRTDVRTRALARRVHQRCRAARWEAYARAFPPRPGERVLDVGVSPLVDLPDENFFLRRYPHPEQVTGVSNDTALDPVRRAFPGVTVLTADGRRLPFGDAGFDVVHSNAVIEHVGPSGDQAAFVAELVRVGRAGFISTPDRRFPVDSHTNLPLLHWLPRPLFLKSLRRLGRLAPEEEWVTWLLTSRTLARRAPAGLELAMTTQRLAGLPAVASLVFRNPG